MSVKKNTKCRTNKDIFRPSTSTHVLILFCNSVRISRDTVLYNFVHKNLRAKEFLEGILAEEMSCTSTVSECVTSYSYGALETSSSLHEFESDMMLKLFFALIFLHLR